MKKYLIKSCIQLLQRHGYLVMERQPVMLLVSGNAIVTSLNEGDTFWQVSFPVKPYLVAMNHSLITKNWK